jgi:hypothetical protein
MLSAAASAYAVTLTVGSGSGKTNDTIEIPVTVDNPVGIAGAAFTIHYNSDHLSLSAIESTFFDTFAHQWAALSSPPDPYPPGSVVVGSDTYYQPLVANHVAYTGTMVAAARCSAETNSANTTLFTLLFELNADSPEGNYSVSVISTTLDNTDAGYDAGGETIAMLIGADPSKDPTDQAAFPIKLNPPSEGSTVAGSVTFDDDVDDDKLPDDWEQQIIDAYPNDEITTIAHVHPLDDFDGDGTKNIVEYLRGTDPTDPDDYPAMGLPWIPLLLLGD